MTIEHVIATHFLRRVPRVDLLAGLARFQVGLIVLYLVLRLADLVYRGATDLVLDFDGLSMLFWAELVVGFLVPLALLSIPDLRDNKWALFLGSCLVAAGALDASLEYGRIRNEGQALGELLPGVR